jgi:hypothetical protein
LLLVGCTGLAQFLRRAMIGRDTARKKIHLVEAALTAIRTIGDGRWLLVSAV